MAIRTFEQFIKHESGDFWVDDWQHQYTVYRQGVTHSTADSSYPRTADGLSLAVARCDYLANRGRCHEFSQ